jgi:hypothetical protein
MMKAARPVWSGRFRWISQRSWGLAGAMSQAVLMRIVLDVAVWGCWCSSCMGGLGFRMVLYIGYLYIRLAQKYALTKCGLGDTPALYLTLIAI